MRLAIFALFAASAHATLFTSVKSGVASDPTVWGFAAGACVQGTNCPGTGDTVKASGDDFYNPAGIQTVTFDYSVALGTSGNAVSGPVGGLTITAGGSDYPASGCGLSFSGGLGGSGNAVAATGTCTFSAGGVATVALTSGGVGYESAPAITVTCGGGACAPSVAATITPILFVGGTPALELAGNSFHGHIVVNSGVDLKLRGSAVCNGTNTDSEPAYKFLAGSTLTFDASQATPTDGVYPRYYIQSTKNSQQACSTAFVGTANSRVTVRSLPGSLGGTGNGGWTYAGHFYSGYVTGDYVDFSDVGGSLDDVVDAAFTQSIAGADTGATFTMDHWTCTRCGTFMHGTDATSMNWSVKNGKTIDSLNPGSILHMQFNGGTLGSGTRSLQNNAFDGGWAIQSPNARMIGLTVTGNAFLRSVSMSSQGIPAAFSGNFVFAQASDDNYRGNGNLPSIAGSYHGSTTSPLANNIFYDGARYTEDRHTITAPGGAFGGSFNIYGNVNDSCHAAYTSSTAAAQGFQFVNVFSGSARTIKAWQNIALGNCDGTNGTILYSVSYGNAPYVLARGFNNTNQIENGPGAITAEGSGASTAGTLVLRGGLYTARAVGLVGGPAQTIFDDTTAPDAAHFADYLSPATSGKNWKYNLTLDADGDAGYENSGNGYHAKFSATPGTTLLDINNVDPAQVAPWRSVVTADRDLWGTAADLDWNAAAGGATFTAGQVVSYTGTCWYGRMVNMRVMATHTKGTANSEPCSGSATDTYWMPNTAWTLHSKIGTCSTGTCVTESDGSLGLSGVSPIERLRAWIREGQRPQNPIGRGASHDGPVVSWTGTLGQYPAGTCTATITVQDADDFGEGATATCEFDGAGAVKNLTITNPGTVSYRVTTPATIGITSSGGAAIVAAALTVVVQPADIGAVAMWPPAFTGQ
jgi:hypothetical protein